MTNRRTIITLTVLFALMLAASTLLSSPQRKPVALAPVVAHNHEEAADFLHRQRVEDSKTTTTTSTTVAPKPQRANRGGGRTRVGVQSAGAAITAAPTISDAKMFIYMHESGNDPTRVARNGACGLGQAVPCSKLPCPLTVAGYACQDEWFTNSYMVPRYGTWEKAKAFWLRGSWW